MNSFKWPPLTPLLLLLLQLLLLLLAGRPGGAVSPGQVAKLTTQQFHQLDREVKEFYEQSYQDLEAKNVSFDEQLFRAIRSIKHTIVIHHNEFRYTSEHYKRAAMGSGVHKDKCRQQLALLAESARATKRDQARAPLTVIDFLDSSAFAESGVLNGNFVWLGSYSSCERAKIPGTTLESFLGPAILERHRGGGGSTNARAPDIKGRYCVAHLRAKSWPKWDTYFEDRITIRKGVCLPSTCHTTIYEQDESIQQLVDYIARQNLIAPFNQDERYETASLYCLPDEDSPFRQWDAGAKLFVLFVCAWLAFTVWTNVKYYQRRKTMQRLRETIDIKMIINERVSQADEQSTSGSSSDDGSRRGSRASDPPRAAMSKRAKSAEILSARAGDEIETGSGQQNASGSIQAERDRSTDEAQTATNGGSQSKSKSNMNLLQTGARQLKKQLSKSLGSASNGKQTTNTEGELATELAPEKATSSGDKSNLSGQDDNRSLTLSVQSSVANTPLPSDLDETDIEIINLIKGDRQKASGKTRSERNARPAANFDYGELDWARAFSVEANFNFLVSPRPASSSKRGNGLRAGQGENNATATTTATRQQRISSKTSITQQQWVSVSRRTSSSNDKLIKDLKQKDSGVAIVSRSELEDKKKPDSLDRSERRVNIEVLDGLKVIATSYIVFGHTLMFFFGCVNDLRFASERMLDFTMAASLNTLQVVGLFYIITGCLLTYLSFSRTKVKHLLSPLFWVMVMIGRYFRLLPAYMLVFWFTRHVATHFGHGRDWYDYRTDVEHPRGFCGQESWWVMWTMSAADVKIPMDCVPQAWYLSDDFRTLLVLPLYIYLLARNIMLGYAAVFATCIYSTMRLVDVLRVAKIDYRILLAWQPHVYSLMADRLHDVYTNFYVRINTYLMGVIVGHVLYMYETKQIKELPRWLRLVGMKLAVIMGALVYFGARFMSNPYVSQWLPSPDSVDSDTVVLLVPIFKVTMEICLSLMVLLLVTGGGLKIIRDFLSCSLMKILSNISYAVFLTHVEVMYKLPGVRFESNYWYLFIYAVYFIVASHAVAFILHLFYEMPINNVIRHVFKKLFGVLQA